MFACALMFVFVGCAADDGPPFTATMLTRPGLLFGYYGDCPTCVEETRDHTNMQWVAGWDSDHGQIETIIARVKKASPSKVVLMLPGMYKQRNVNPAGLAAARAIFAGLRNEGVLGNVVAVYPQDEPDVQRLDDATVTRGNSELRTLMADFGIDDVPLAVIYSGSGGRPGIGSYNWVGMDSYRKGSKILGGPYRSLKNNMRADQRLLLVPGGASPWQQDPAKFFKFAEQDPQVVGVVAFLWFDNAAPQDGVGQGIRSNKMTEIYRQWGRAVS
jgi:hypothetical protein